MEQALLPILGQPVRLASDPSIHGVIYDINLEKGAVRIIFWDPGMSPYNSRWYDITDVISGQPRVER